MFASRASRVAHELDAKDYPVISPGELRSAEDREEGLLQWRQRQAPGVAFQTRPVSYRGHRRANRERKKFLETDPTGPHCCSEGLELLRLNGKRQRLHMEGRGKY